MNIHQAREIEQRARQYQHHLEMEAKYRTEDDMLRLDKINGELYPVGVAKKVSNILADYHKEEVDRLGSLLEAIQRHEP